MLSLIIRYFLLITILNPVLFSAPKEANTWFPEILKNESKDFLPNYSYAGYRWGEKEIPIGEATIKIEEFGAKPNDGKDDTKAILKALKFAMKEDGHVVLKFPPGRFLINDILYLERSQLILKGSGSGEGGTTLAFTRSLEKMRLPESFHQRKEYLIKNKKYSKGKLFSLFSWSGGVIWTRRSEGSKFNGPKLMAINGTRGAHVLELDTVASWRPGDTLDLRWHNTEGKNSRLLEHIYGKEALNIGSRLYERPESSLFSQPVTVESVEDKIIKIKEPLLHDLKPSWNNTLQQVNHLEEVGIEGFRLEFPESKYAGHHLEEGFNGLYITQLKHGWVRDVVIHNTDAGILTSGSKNLTFEGVRVTGRTGHYSVHMGGSYGVLCKDFHFESRALHDPSFNSKATLCVYSNGVIRQAKLDQHNGVNHQNLFDNLKIEDGTKLFQHGGAKYWSPTAGQFNTFWNINVQKAKKVSCREAPSARIIGLICESKGFKLDYHPKPYVEGLNKRGISVPSLYEYQLNQRVKK